MGRLGDNLPVDLPVGATIHHFRSSLLSEKLLFYMLELREMVDEKHVSSWTMKGRGYN